MQGHIFLTPNSRRCVNKINQLFKTAFIFLHFNNWTSSEVGQNGGDAHIRTHTNTQNLASSKTM